MDKNLALYAHETAALATDDLTMIFREAAPSYLQADKGMEPEVTFSHELKRFRFVKARSHLARVGGEDEGIEQPLTTAQLSAGGFADEAAFLQWAAAEGISRNLTVIYLEPL